MPRKNRNNRASSSHLPPVPGQINDSMRLRFSNTVACVNTTIQANYILSAMGLIAVSSTQGYAIHRSFRIKRISVWSPAAAPGSSIATCTIYFPASGGTFETAKEYTDSSLSPSYPAYLSVRPPSNSYSSMWYISTTNPVFQLTCGAYSIIDIELDGVFSDGVGASTYTLVAATTGALYYSPLDAIGGVIGPVARTGI